MERTLARALCILVLAAAGIVAPPIAIARDFPDPIALADPWSVAPDGSHLQFAPAGYGDLSFNHYSLLSGQHDLFSVRSRVGGVPVSIGPVAIGAHWASILMVGPLDPGDEAASVARWWMNSVQFEYGIVASLRMGPVLRSVTVEYGRTSQHPFRSGFSEIASDLMSVGVWPHEVIRQTPSGRRLALRTGLVAAHVDLYDFWQSPLARPRTRLRFSLPIWASIGLTGRVTGGTALVLNLEPRILVLRTEGANAWANVSPLIQAEMDLEILVAFLGHARFELGLEIFRTRDSEQRRGESSPLTTVGFVMRLGS